MRRTVSALLCFIALLLLCGCENKNPFIDETVSFSYYANSSAMAQIESEFTSSVQAKIYGDIRLIEFTSTVSRGNMAEIVLKGINNTEYEIRVIYSSGVSKASDLGAQVSDRNGYICWKWRVGASTKVGTYPVEITENDKTVLKTYLTVTE